MADINNFTEISENFSTIKTLLNSIRAQGILNTSDVDKLLSGINSKLERLNTEEDIDLIKIFLSELKQNLDERHSVLISKFGAIESLFTNLLKNSADSLKSSEIKELFDIVATNLSVFSREVVSQKDTLTDILLRIDAMRSDETQKKDIIKNISTLKTDLEHLNNGFDSIVLSLNENFKAVIKTIANIDHTDSIKQFGREIENVTNSSNTILSALQMLDKKVIQIDERIRPLVQQDDVNAVKRAVSDLSLKSQEIANAVEVIGEKHYKLDNLAEKIDASVSIIAGLKAVFADSTDSAAQKILDQVAILDAQIKEIASDDSFNTFKQSLESVFNNISNETLTLKNHLISSENQLKKINDSLKSLDIITGFQGIMSDLNKQEHSIKEHVDTTIDKVSQLIEVNATRSINSINSCMETLGSQLKDTGISIGEICDKNYKDLVVDIASLKSILSQIDENNTSGNNAIFSNVTDRLAIFEKSLQNSLEKQEAYLSTSSSNLLSELAELKNSSSLLDYKIDSSVIQMSNSKNEFAELKAAIENMLALDFTNVVKDLRVDLYASKQEIENVIESLSSDISEKFVNDIFSKYELLISRIDSLEDNLKSVQISSLNSLKPMLDNISSSILDVLSYVSEKTTTSSENIDIKLANITDAVKENNLNYIENVRDIVDAVRVQLENNLIQIAKKSDEKIDTINLTISDNTNKLKEEIRYSYNKLLEVQDDFKQVCEVLDSTNNTNSSNFENIIENTKGLRQDFDVKLSALKKALLDNVSDFKQELFCENADKISELKFASESLHQKNIQSTTELNNELKQEVVRILDVLRANIKGLSEQLSMSVLSIESANKDVVSYIKNDFYSFVDGSLTSLQNNFADLNNETEARDNDIISSINKLETSVNTLANTTTNSLSSTLAQVLDNFVALKSLMSNLLDENSDKFSSNVDRMIEEFTNLKELLNSVDSNIDEDLTRQLSIIENGFDVLSSQLENSFTRNEELFAQTLETGLSNISSIMQSSLNDRLEEYKSQIEELFANLTSKSDNQSQFINDKVLLLNTTLQSIMSKQNEVAHNHLKNISDEIKVLLDEKIELTQSDYESLRHNLQSLAISLEENNKNYSNEFKELFEQTLLEINSGLEVQASQINSKFNDIETGFSNVSDIVANLNSDVKKRIEDIISDISTLKDFVKDSNDTSSSNIIDKLEELAQELDNKNQSLESMVVSNIAEINNSNALLEKQIKDGLKNFSNDLTQQENQNSNALIQKIENLNTNVTNYNNDLNSTIKVGLTNLSNSIDTTKGDLDSSIQNVEFKILEKITSTSEEIQNSIEAIETNIETNNDNIREAVATGLIHINNTLQANVNNLKDDILETRASFDSTLEKYSNKFNTKINDAITEIAVKTDEIDFTVSNGFANINSKIESSFVSQDTKLNDFISSIDSKLITTKESLETTLSKQNDEFSSNVNTIFNELNTVNSLLKEQFDCLNSVLASSIMKEVEELQDSLIRLFESNSVNISTSINNSEVKLTENLSQMVSELKNSIEDISAKLSKGEAAQIDLFKNRLQELSFTFNTLIEEAKNVTKAEVSSISEILINNSNILMDDLEQSIEKNINNVLVTCADISAGELRSMEAFTNQIIEQIETGKRNSVACKKAIEELLNKNTESLNENIEKETDLIVKDIIEQAELLKEFQKDELSKLTVHVESSIEDYIYNYINELKSYLDVKTNNSEIEQRLDNLAERLNNKIEDVLSNVNKMLHANIFEGSISDLKVANEILISSMKERLTEDIENFIKENSTMNLQSLVNIFNDKFMQMVLDEYNQIQNISWEHKNKLEALELVSQNLVKEFINAKNDIQTTISDNLYGINNSINKLSQDFASLKEQILDKKFDESLQTSISTQISDVEKLVQEQLGYLEDISTLCCNNLPELTEMNAIVKYGIQQAITELSNKFDNSALDIEPELNKFKSDIITQFLNIFNQISFVAEQEEILDFIQEKHSDLITILSHIVTNIQSVSDVKDTVSHIDSKVNTLKDDIKVINKKISSIISSEGDVDYAYSLQDLELDIANLRLVLSDIKNNGDNSKEFEELITSTNDIYKLVESIKEEFPKFEADEFRKDFDALAEDIVSISTRTNKLLLTSDESYKTLQDNLQDFKLVINDLDERTRNFAQDAGLNRLDDKLGAINTMIQNGAKTNQVFNQVFEYLAEWVDKAGEQITTISDKVETLDDIGQIKVMLQDLKAEAEDNSDSLELIEALGNVFDKQAKKIASLESKLDRIIVETTISNQKNKIDMSPIEETLNRFLIAIDDKMALQQVKIKSLETKLEEVVSLIDPKDTVQLTKKVGGMDRQIAKLNKSIEKIASHVVEK